MSKKFEGTVTVYKVERLGLSYFGNPRYSFHTSEGWFNTGTDSSFGYEVSNLGEVADTEMLIKVNGRGTLEHAELV